MLTQVLGGYRTKCRGEIMMRGKGVITTYWLLGRVGAKNLDEDVEGYACGPSVFRVSKLLLV